MSLPEALLLEVKSKSMPKLNGAAPKLPQESARPESSIIAKYCFFVAICILKRSLLGISVSG